METRICQNCNSEFAIDQDDFSFYQKIKVPPPTFCPECRMIRRLNFRNERFLYRIKCNSCNNEVISIYQKESLMNVFCQDCWWGDSWDPLEYGVDYDFSKSFFQQFKNLYLIVPQMSLFNTKPINSDYCNFAAENKNSYLFFGGKSNENVLYSHNSAFNKDSLDISLSAKLELCYESIQCDNSNKLFFSKSCDNCVSSYFLYECKNCIDCFGCSNLRNKQHCLFNEQLSKEEYENRVRELN